MEIMDVTRALPHAISGEQLIRQGGAILIYNFLLSDGLNLWIYGA